MIIFSEEERDGLVGHVELKEAAPMEVSDLSSDRRKLGQFFGKIEAASDGMHGQVMVIQPKANMGGRFARKGLGRALANKNFRWISYDDGSIQIGI